MKKSFIFSSLVILSASFAACTSGTSTETANANIAANSNPTLTNSVPTDANTNPTLQNVPVQNNAANSPIPGIPVPANANIKISNNDPTKTLKPQMPSNPAPDNSEVTSSLGATLVEIRTFKNHPLVSKVEVTGEPGKDDKKVKIYLKNGQVKEVPYNKDVDLMKISGNEIAKLAGLEAKTEPTAVQTNTQTTTKKAEDKPKEDKKPANN